MNLKKENERKATKKESTLKDKIRRNPRLENNSVSLRIWKTKVLIIIINAESEKAEKEE